MYIHLFIHTHTNAHISTQIPEKDFNVLSDLKAIPISELHSTLLRLPFCYQFLLHLCWMLCYELINYIVVPNSK